MFTRREKFAFWLAWKLPERVVYWCFIRMATENCPGYPGDQTVGEVVRRWSNDHSALKDPR